MPSIFKSICGYMILLISIYSLANYLIITIIVSQRHLQIERKLAQQEIALFNHALLREEEFLKIIAHNWSTRNDTYNFIQTPNTEYIKSNFTDTTLTRGRFNLLYFFRLDGSIVWRRLLDLETGGEISIDELPPSGLPPDHPLLHLPEVDDAINGLVHTAYGPLLITSQPIVASEKKGPIVGTMMLGRFLTDELMTKLQLQTKIHCRIVDLDAKNTLADIPVNVSSLSPHTPFLFHEINNKIITYSLLNTFQGKPKWLLEIYSDRLVNIQPKEILTFVLLSSIAMGSITFLVFLIIYRYQFKAATSVFQGLIDQSLPKKIKERRKFPLLRSFSSDEFSELSYDLRAMIASLEQDKEQQKNIITQYTSSLRQLNTKLVEEIKKRLLIEKNLHSAQQDLEKQVEKRTSELQQTNTALQHEIERRKKEEDDLIKHRKRLRALSAEILEIEDKERRHLATDLHDQVGQSLAAVKMYVDGLIADISDKTTLNSLKLIADIVEETVQDIRTLTFELSPPVLYELGLGAALEWLAEEFQDKYSIKISLICNTCFKCSSPAFLALIFRTIRELLINVVRHADTDSAEVEVHCTGKDVRLIVSDKGCGMERGNQDQKGGENTSEGFGLFSIRERITNIGGTVEIDSQKNKGTTIVITIPKYEACSNYIIKQNDIKNYRS